MPPEVMEALLRHLGVNLSHFQGAGFAIPGFVAFDRPAASLAYRIGAWPVVAQFLAIGALHGAHQSFASQPSAER